MPATRKSTRSSSGGGKQATLSFNHRVTKSGPKSAKDAVKQTTPSKPSPLSKVIQPDDDVEVEPPKEASPPPVEVLEKTEAEVKAGKTSDAQINKYWRGIESQRTARRVHQEDLDVGEKVLRYFDVSSQYGPCIGMSRMRRWNRAEKLGLNPPIEVLAVLLKEDAKGNQGIEKAHMDEILNSTALGAV